MQAQSLRSRGTDEIAHLTRSRVPGELNFNARSGFARRQHPFVWVSAARFPSGWVWLPPVPWMSSTPPPNEM